MFQFLLLAINIFLSHESCSMKKINGTLMTYDGPPQLLDDDGKKIFEKLCQPMIGENLTDSFTTCCDTDQLEEFEEQIQDLNSIIPSCQVCRQNIYSLTCNLICHKNQSSFTHIHSVNSTVESLDFALAHDMARRIFESCKDVIFPGMNYHVILMLCSKMPGKCNPINMIRSMLSYSSFPINVTFYHNNSLPDFPSFLNESTLKCNETFYGFSLNVSACGCQDCRNSCSVPFLPDEVFKKIANLTYYQFTILILLLVTLVVLFGLYLFYRYKNRYHSILYESNPVPDIDDQFGVDSHGQSDYEILNASFQGRVLSHVNKYMIQYAVFVATHKTLTILLSIIFLIICSSGVAYRFKIQSDPVEIWSPKHDEFRQQKDFFDANFGPFYRTEQIILSTSLASRVVPIDEEDITFGPPFHEPIMLEIFQLQDKISKLSVKVDENGTVKDYKLDDFCIKPTAPFKNDCAMFSVTQYFQNDITLFKKSNRTWDEWLLHMDTCINNQFTMADQFFYNVSCMANFGGTVDPKLVFGGFKDHAHEASSFIITYMLNSKNATLAKAWEFELLKFLANYSNPIIKISYSAERSIEDEIDRQSHSEAKAVIASYIVMFLYVSFALGRFSCHCKALMIQQKIMLGFFGVLIVFLSVLSSIGLFCYMKYDVNLIVLEVLPFLALAIGVDNIFLMVDRYYRVKFQLNTDTPIPSIVGMVFGSTGQGMIVSALIQICTFLIGSISNIPAVKSFCLFAAVTIFINFLMQITLFLALFTLDAIRENDKRADIFYCIQFHDVETSNRMGILDFVFHVIGNILFSKIMKRLILVVFVILWFACLFVIPSIPVGLDQTDALPSDSYLSQYFADLFEKLKAGPPLYFMVEPGYHYENSTLRNLICSGYSCDNQSLTNIINQYSMIPEKSKIATNSFSWIDAYIAWLTTSDNACCSFKKSNHSIFCPSYSRIDKDCAPCFEETPKISSEIFSTYLPWFLSDIPTKICPFGGKPLYSQLVVLNDKYDKKNPNDSIVKSSAFMTFHASLVKSEDFKEALSRSIYIAKNISVEIGHKVTPYSIFYIYYGAYLKIWKEFSIYFSIAFVVVTIIHMIMYLFCIRMVFIMTFVTVMMSVTNLGCMYLMQINLNPVSLVNLIMLVGINIEFLSHMGRAYMITKSQVVMERSQLTFIETGPSIFSGITLTKLFGIIVLGASKSKLFKLYYFKMYLGAIIIGALHGLFLLPILLHYIGPNIKLSNSDQDSQEIITE